MAKENINQVYQWNLRTAFLGKLEILKPKIIRDLKSKIFTSYQKTFAAELEKISYEELQDAISDPENYSTETHHFAQIFTTWIRSSNLEADWLSDTLLSLLFNWTLKPQQLEKGHLYDCLSLAYFPSFGKDFEFKFRSLRRDETPANYRKSLESAFKQQQQLYLAEMKSQFSVIPISKNKLKHIEWLIQYHFNPKTTFEAIAGDIVRNSKKPVEKETTNKETIRKAVVLISQELQFPIRNGKAT